MADAILTGMSSSLYRMEYFFSTSRTRIALVFFMVLLQLWGKQSGKAPRFGARGIAGPGLIAQIVVSKFGDHLPLYRLEDIFVRHGLHIARSTMCDWVSAAAKLLKPLHDLQRQLALQSAVMWTDDTPVTVLTGGEEGSRLGRFWTYIETASIPIWFTTSR